MVHFDAKIGNNCRILPNGIPDAEPPVIGDNIFIGTSAVVIGRIHIGNNVIIGANSVVTRDVPENSIAVGSPAKIWKRKDI